MFRRKPMEGTPAYKPKGYPDGATPLLPIQRLPLLLPMLDGRAGRGKDGTWWRDNKSQRLPCLSPESPYAPRDRGTVRALLLPPLLPNSSAREAGARGNRQPKDHDNRDTLRSLLRELLPHKFSRFLNKLRAKSVDTKADPPSAPQYPRSTSDHCLASPCSSCSFLPDLWDQPLQGDDGFREKTTLGLPKDSTAHRSQSEDCAHLQPLWRRLKTPQTPLPFPGTLRRRDPAGHSTPVLGTQPCSPAEHLSERADGFASSVCIRAGAWECWEMVGQSAQSPSSQDPRHCGRLLMLELPWHVSSGTTALPF
ncbi:uncharacterized protein C9orf50 homolog isoform X4 [Mastomys coucha]|uniref:uncharacterized protein C9orf50 homolog isoform X4 n=1 Tax=Mastomys coucha TaxID=35658 RepID=UPI001261C48F|nr:uncharacterized protein C9orf50 homolog isoform X4 [Mastomys coucha]